ncbi:hypothetical protein [Bradyrhizobium cosmicum]|uniref:hypothetical protein n=1 Tax=Bradyrhizobium cosmicum TaxID=1404864 RepID=UPI0028E45C87|nr:hypothetical protein [Bradyrhizobium cosmicum]
MQQSPSSIILSPEQAGTTSLLRQLFGNAVASRYVDFCKLVGGDLPLHATRTLAAHALRELDALLRQVLASPFDAVIRDDPSEKALRKKARKSLKEIGFDEEARQRADGALKPQLNFKRQVERILTRLGLDPEGEIAKKWLSFRDALSQVHQRSFDKTLRIDDEFRRTFAEPFDAVIWALATALQERYSALLQRASEIAAMGPETGMDAFVKEIPGAAQLQRHFYDRLNSEDWLPALEERGLLGEPSFTKEEDDTGFGQWPVSRYLLRMAKSENAQTRAIVLKAIGSLAASVHPDVHHDGMEVVAALPTNEAALLADVIAGWLRPDFALVLQFPPVIIEKLARAGEIDAALKVAAAFFQVFDTGGRLATLHDHLMYEHFLPKSMEDLAAAGPTKALALFCGLLEQVIVIRRRSDENSTIDDSNYLVGDFDDNPSHRDIPACIAAAILRCAESALKSDGSQPLAIVTEVKSHRGRLFERIAMKIVAMSPAALPDLAAAYLTDQKFIDQDWCRKEYAAIANVWFGSLDPQSRQSILDFIYAIPDDHRFDEWFRKTHGKPPTERERREYRFSEVRDVVWGWRNALPDALRLELEAGVAEFGDPDHWRNTLYREAESPLTSAQLRALPIEDCIEFLKTRRVEVSEDDHAFATDALANQLRIAAAEDPIAFSAKAFDFEKMEPIILRRFLEAMEQAAFNGVSVSWGDLLALMARLCHDIPSSSGSPSAQHRYRIVRGMIDVISAGLRTTDAIPPRHTADLLGLARALYSISLQVADPYGNPDLAKSDPFHHAQQTIRGAAVELCVRLLRWLRQNAPSDIDATDGAASALHDFRSILEAELSGLSDATDVGRTIMGRYLNLLYDFDPDWLRRQLSSLLPRVPEPSRNPAWRAHLENDRGPVDALMSETAFCYADDIEKLAKPDADRDAHNHRLAEHLLTLHLRGTLPPHLLARFLDVASVGLRRDAMRLIGLTIGTSEQVYAERAKSYWMQRLAAATSTTDQEQYRKEIGAIGLWFLWVADVDWLMNQMLAVLSAGYAPNDVYTVIRHLASIDGRQVERVVDVLYALAISPHTGRYALMVQGTEIRRILVTGKRSGIGTVASKVDRIVNLLASKGNDTYLDLLDGSTET